MSAVEQLRGDTGASYQRVTLEVSAVWKGPIARETVVFTGSGGGDCGYFFEPGKEYLVYATMPNGGSPQIVPANSLTTGICSRTAPLDQAGADLAALGPGAPPTDAPLPTLPNTGEGYPPAFTFSSTPSLLALLFLSAVLLGAGTIGRRAGRDD